MLLFWSNDNSNATQVPLLIGKIEKCQPSFEILKEHTVSLSLSLSPSLTHRHTLAHSPTLYFTFFPVFIPLSSEREGQQENGVKDPG